MSLIFKLQIKFIPHRMEKEITSKKWWYQTQDMEQMVIASIGGKTANDKTTWQECILES